MVRVLNEKAIGQASRNAGFVRLFIAHERRLLAFIFSLLPNLTDAEEVLQETSVVLWEKFDQFEPDVAVVFEGGDIATGARLYVDGRQESKKNFQPQIVSTVIDQPRSTRLQFGAEMTGGSHFRGEMDEIYLFDFALSDLQVQRLMHHNLIP